MNRLIQFIDLFYPPFRRLMPEQTFRYAFCGGTNTVLGLSVYFIFLNEVFHHRNFDFGWYAFKPHNAALFVATIINFIVGFILMKFVVFVDSNLRGHIQLVRYLLSFLFNLVLNYFLLMLFVESFGWDAFLSQCITTGIVIIVSYLSQKHFSFKVKPES